MKRPFMMLFTISLLFLLILSGCKSDEAVSNDPDKLEDNEKETTEEGIDTSSIDVSEIEEFHQSPSLDEQDIPAVKERLPKEPKLTNEVPPEMLDYEIGRYGGTLDTVTSQVDWDADYFVLSNEPLLNTPGILGEEITGNILKDYEVSKDQKEFTFFLREGLKWSDGESVTMEDFRFAIEDVLFNKEITPIVPSWLKSGGDATASPMTFEVVDDWTFKISFDEPYGGFPIRLAIQGWRGYSDLLKPAHYLKQYHKDYADESELAKVIEEEGYKSGQWVSLFTDMDITERELNHPGSEGFPVLYPWVTKEVSTTHFLFERNPYYFKVDAEGNQLPYIDEVKSTYVQDPEMIGLKTIAGEVDLSRETTALVKMPLYRENAEASGFKAILANMHVTPSDIFLNLTYEDKVWREVVRDKRFRQALNYAINKEEIIESLYYGFAELPTVTDSTYDVEKANQLLDEMGMEKGPDGYRVGPDGERFTIPFDIAPFAPDMGPLAELLIQYFEKIGIHTTVKTIDQALWTEREEANELQASIMWTHTPLWYMNDFGQGLWAPLWTEWWNTGGEKGEEPPEEAKEFYRLLDQVNVKPPEEAIKAVEKLKQNIYDNTWYLVYLSEVKQPMIINSKIGNYTENLTAIGVNFSGEQFFFKE